MRFFCIITSILMVVSAMAAQENNDLCPTIEVIEPARVTNPGDKMTFVAKLSRADSAFRFEWSVSPAGRLVEGQGTPAITVLATEPNANVISTVSVFGLPAGCDNVAKGVGRVAPIPELESLFEWENISRNEERVRLDIFFADVSDNPGFKGVLVFTGVPANKRNAKNSRLKFFIEYARFRKFDPALLHFVFLNEMPDFQRVTVYRMRNPANYPCSDCIRVEGKDVK